MCICTCMRVFMNERRKTCLLFAIVVFQMYLFTLVEVNIQIQKNNDLNTSLKIYQKLKNNDCSNSNVFELLNISFSL